MPQSQATTVKKEDSETLDETSKGEVTCEYKGTLEERRKCVEELKKQWKTLWLDRINDKVRAEGISDKDYLKLFVERGTVITATRKFKALDFYEILQKNLLSESGDINNLVHPNPVVGGWGKFARNVLSKQQPLIRWRRSSLAEPVRKAHQQLKKGGRGWLHFKR